MANLPHTCPIVWLSSGVLIICQLTLLYCIMEIFKIWVILTLGVPCHFMAFEFPIGEKVINHHRALLL